MCNFWDETMLLVRVSIYVRVHICTCTCATTWHVCMCIPAHTGNLWYETTSFWQRLAHKNTNIYTLQYIHIHMLIGKSWDETLMLAKARTNRRTHIQIYTLCGLFTYLCTHAICGMRQCCWRMCTHAHTQTYTLCYIFSCM